ncbi:MAG: helix-turn-helix transcriptional regulator [Thermoflexales bacterium]|nr:helix-turn-helix transcriptional regulator [Thermoflexales bacterium]
MKARDWNASEAAYRMRVPSGTISRVLNGTRRAGPDLCQRIAKAFNEPLENIYRLAGLLPATPASMPATHETQDVLSRLDEKGKQLLTRMAHAIIEIYG